MLIWSAIVIRFLSPKSGLTASESHKPQIQSAQPSNSCVTFRKLYKCSKLLGSLPKRTRYVLPWPSPSYLRLEDSNKWSLGPKIETIF